MDIQYLLFWQNIREVTGGIFNSLFLFISDLGWSVLPVIIMAGIYWCIDKKAGRYILMNCYVAGWINGILKLTACVYRPWVRSSSIKPVPEALTTATGYSFPSGHTCNGVGLWGGLAVSYRKRPLARNCFILIAVLIGISRNYLGVHTPQDVIVSALVGVVMLYVTFKVMNVIENDTKKDIWVLVICAVLAVVMIVYASVKSYPMDYVDGVLLVDPKKMALDSWGQGGEILGFGIGWFVERRFINFSSEADTATRFGRFLVGGLVLAVLFYVLNPLLVLIMNASIAKFLSRFLIVIYIMIIHPLCIKKWMKPQA